MTDVTDDKGTPTTSATLTDASVTLTPAPTEERFKDDETYKAMSKQLADMQRKEQERVDADTKAKKEAEIKDLESKGQYEAAIKAREQEVESLKATHLAELLQRDIQGELLKTGFQNDLFIEGAVAKYDVETHGSVADYVAALAANEGNKVFLNTAQGRQVHESPGKVPSGSNASYTEAQIRALENSDDQEKRMKAIEIKKDYLAKHGNFEGLLK